MDNINQQLAKAMTSAAGGEVRVPTSRAEMSDDQAKAVAYFYARLSAVYGPEYMRCFPDEKTEAVSKREHGPFIMGYTKAQIEKGIDALHVSRQSGEDKYKWLNIDEVIGLVKSGGNVTGDRVGAYKVFDKKAALTDQTALAKRKVAGRSCLDEMLGSLKEVKRAAPRVPVSAVRAISHPACESCGYEFDRLLNICEKCGEKRDD
jgi:predicted Zn-ribbon and HTH transcriptional regulator